jgi:hypothetical protein
MPPTGRLTFVLLAAMVAVPASAEATLEFNLPAQIYREQDVSGVTPNDQGRCFVPVFVEFPKIKHAKGYKIVIARTDLAGKRGEGGQRTEYIAPPFQTTGFSARYPSPDGFARFFLFAYGSGEGCAQTIAATEGKAVIVSAKVRLDKPYERRFRKVDKEPWMCGYLPGSRTVNLGSGGDPRKIIVRKQGSVSTIDEGSQQSVNVMTNTYAVAGTIVKTGRDSIVKIGALDGSSALVGPNTWVRLTDDGFEIVKQPKHPSFKVKWRPDSDYKVRTCPAVLSARG